MRVATPSLFEKVGVLVWVSRLAGDGHPKDPGRVRHGSGWGGFGANESSIPRVNESSFPESSHPS